jgi:hypothetical protein
MNIEQDQYRNQRIECPRKSSQIQLKTRPLQEEQDHVNCSNQKGFDRCVCLGVDSLLIYVLLWDV